MPVIDNPLLKRNIPTEPMEADRPPHFGQITSLVKDVCVTELRRFLSTEYTRRKGELVTVNKYAVAANIEDDPLATATEIVRAYPDLTENLPMVAVLSTSGKNHKLGLGTNYVANVQWPPTIWAANPGPYALRDGDFIEIVSTPYPRSISTWNSGQDDVKSTIRFISSMFRDIGNADIEDISRAMRAQALYTSPTSRRNGDQVFFGVQAGGPAGPSTHPNLVRVVGGSPNALQELGLAVGQERRSTDADQQILHRYYMAASLTVAIEIAAESELGRTEITDLVYSFFTFVMGDRNYTFLGRSTFDSGIPDETYQVIIQDAEISISGEQEWPRPGDQFDKVFINRVNVPVVAILYVDRVATDAMGNPLRPYIGASSEFDGSLPMPS